MSCLSLEGGEVIPETMAPEKTTEAEMVKTPPIPLKDIVKEKYVVCLECGKKMRTLKAHIRKTHGLMPKEYFKRFGLDPKKYPLLVRSTLPKEARWRKIEGLGRVEAGGRRRLK